LSRIEATHHSVEHDLLFRWAVESLFALGVQLNHALSISQVVVRSCERTGSAQPLHRLASELGRILDGSLSKGPDHELSRLSGNLLTTQIRNGHPVLALHDAVEFARQAAVEHRWGAVRVDGADFVDAPDTYLADTAKEGVAGLALVAGAARWDAVRITAAFPEGKGGAELFDVPVLLLLARAEVFSAAFEGPGPGIAALLSEFLGMSLMLAGDFWRVRPRCVQLLAADTERFGASVSRFKLNLQQHGLVACTSEGPMYAMSAKRMLPVDHELRTLMQMWSRQLGVFDPFA